jgi:hypothetical protein
MTLAGGCLCGAVRLQVTGPLGPVTACHCTQCRKVSGHFTAAGPVARSDLRVEGPLRWFQSSPGARRGFCPDCGSYLLWDDGSDTLYLSAGALDGATGQRLVGHIYVADKGDYYDIADGLPVWPQGPDDGSA